MSRLEGEVRIERRQVPKGHQLSLLQHVYVERGTHEDWAALEALHYKSSKLGVGPRYIRCVLAVPGQSEETIGVMVFTVPKILDAGRNEVFPHLKPNQGGVDGTLQNRMRVTWMNKNILLSSRTVLDTMYRGAGIAYRFKNLGYRMTGFRFIESRSSMSRYNPFSVKAGMKFVKPKAASGMEQGLLFFSRNFTSPAFDFAAIMQELKAMPQHVRDRTLQDMRDFYYRHSSMEKSGDKRELGTSRIDQLPTDELLRQVMQLTFGATVYAVFQNPDHGRDLPARIPLLAFHNQGLNEPLRLDLLT
jgi:ABC-type ATPase with predicted acetyltransferase domain